MRFSAFSGRAGLQARVLDTRGFRVVGWRNRVTGRKALRIKPGDKLEYEVKGDHATIRVHRGTRALKGTLASRKGRGTSFAQIRAAASKGGL